MPRWAGFRIWYDEEGKLQKEPLDPNNPEFPAKCNDSSTLGTFDQALKLVRTGTAQAVAYALDKDYSVIDLDGCRDPETGAIDERGREVLERFPDTYADLSASETGVHVWLEGPLPGPGKHPDGVGAFDHGRFIITTGRVYRDAPIRNYDGELARWYRETFGETGEEPEAPYKGPRSRRLEDQEVLDLAFGSKVGDKIKALWEGKWRQFRDYPSQSEADAALIRHLAFWTQDLQQLGRLFKQSKLFRLTKWNREDYRRRTFELAFRGLKEVWQGEPQTKRKTVRWYNFTELSNIPPPEFRIRDVMETDSLLALYGETGIGKTFVTLDMALCVAAGIPWQGREVKPGLVAYVLGEGVRGLGPRVNAWREARGVPAEILDRRFLVLPQALDVPDSKTIDGLLADFAGFPEAPAVVVLDTLARHFVGYEENSSKDMGLFTEGMDHIRRETGATVLAIHHTGKNGTERGSSALKGNCDTAIHLTGTGQGTLVMRSAKVRNAVPFENIKLRLVPAGDSAVIDVADTPSPDDVDPEDLEYADISGVPVKLRKTAQRIMRALQGEHFPVAASDLQKSLGVSRSTVYRNLEELVKQGLIRESGSGMYSLTEEGRDWLAAA